MSEFLVALGGGCVGAAVAILAHRRALTRYYDIVECLWNNDLKRVNKRIDDILLEQLKGNVVRLSTKSVNKAVDK